MNNTDIRLLGLASFASMASMRMCDPMLLQWAQEFQATPGQASHVIAAFAIAYGVMQLIHGPLGDRFNKVRLIAWGAALSALLSVLTAMSAGIDSLGWSRSAMGAVAAGIIPLSMALIGDKVSYDRRQHTLARLMSATVSGLMAGQWFGGFTSQYLGWRWAFYALAALFAGAAILLMRSEMFRTADTVSHKGPDSVAAYLRNMRGFFQATLVQKVLLLTWLEGVLAFGALVFIPSVLIKDFHMSSSAAGSAMLLYGLGGLAYSHFAKKWIAWLGEAGLAIAGGCLIATGLSLLLGTHHTVGALCACLVTGMGLYMLHNVLQTQATQMAPDNRSTALTMFASLLFLGQSCGVVVLSWSVDANVLHETLAAFAVAVVFTGLAASRQSPGKATPVS